MLSEDAATLSTAQNIENLRTLTDASADKAELLLDAYSNRVQNVAGFVSSYHGNIGMTEDELVDYMRTIYDLDEYNWQLVDNKTNEGTAIANIGFATVQVNAYSEESKMYDVGSYRTLANIFSTASEGTVGKIRIATEFTDAFDLDNAFAVTTCVRLNSDDGAMYKTLMLVIPSVKVTNTLDSNNRTDNYSYFNFSSVIIDKNGDYVISNQFFQNKNFIDYLKSYNSSVTSAKGKEILALLKNGEVPEPLYYNNNRNNSCVYIMSPVLGTDWYLLSMVPIESFHNMSSVGRGYYLFIAAFIALFAVDMTYAIFLNRRLGIKTREAEVASLAKGNFMSRMSHEIRTPLNAIIGYNTIAQDELAKTTDEASRRQAEMKTLDCLCKSGIASKHLLSVINDVLDMSAIESGKIKVANERFDFKGLISSITTVFYSQASAKGVEFDVILGKLCEEWFVGDQLRVNQIIANLLSNAIKFTPEGGKVVLKIDETEIYADSVHIHFEVTDTGIGMTEEYLSHIWTPFEQADSTISRRFGGTGLGLTITKNLVELMNGSIKVESTVGKGSVFTVDLDFKRTKQPNAIGTYDFSGIKALIVDDDQSTCDYIRLLFERCGARSDAVTSGAQAVRVYDEAAKANDGYSVCLIDWRMPNMDGIETIKQLRHVAKPDVPIIVITAYDFTEIADKAAELGVSQFISKPLFQSAILDMLANICHMPKLTAAEGKINAASFKGERVLLAEDNTMNMEIAKHLLQHSGLTVDSAWNGREVVDMFLAEPQGTYDLILMDIHMPEVDGYQATAKIRNSGRADAKTIPILAMTADAFAEDVAQAIESGMNDHIAKPIDVTVLFEKLSRFIKK